jgi:hypothetical protein
MASIRVVVRVSVHFRTKAIDSFRASVWAKPASKIKAVFSIMMKVRN